MFCGGENIITAKHLQAGETCKVIGVGNSMTPILKSKQAVICEPVKPETAIAKRDIVLCKVRGHFYLHLVLAIRGNQFQIGNNHGHVNGWVTRKNIYGIVTKILKGNEQ